MFNLHLSILIGQPDSVKQGSNPPPYSYPETSIPGTVKAVGGSMKAIIMFLMIIMVYMWYLNLLHCVSLWFSRTNCTQAEGETNRREPN